MIGDGEVVCYDKLQFEMNGEVLESKIGNNDFEDSRPGNLPSRWIFSVTNIGKPVITLR